MGTTWQGNLRPWLTRVVIVVGLVTSHSAFADDSNCLTESGLSVIRGVASQIQYIEPDGPSQLAWIITPLQPVCVMEVFPGNGIASPKQVASFQILGESPPTDVMIELTGHLSTGNVTPHLARPDVLTVVSGRKIGPLPAPLQTVSASPALAAPQQLQPQAPHKPQPLYNGEEDKIQGYDPNADEDAAKIQVANLRLHQCVFDQEVPLLNAGERSKNIVTQTAAQRCRARIEQNADDLYALRKLSSVAPDPALMFNTWILVIASDQLEYILRHGSEQACLTPADCQK